MPDNKEIVEIYSQMRERAFAVEPEQIGVVVGPAQPFGILMETGYPQAVATLVAMGEGLVSLYFSNGGGIIGGGQHEAVRQAGLAFIEKSVDFLSFMQPGTSFSLPSDGHVRFYVLTKSGIYTSESTQIDLQNNKSRLSPLFYSGQSVITQLRLISKKN